MLGAWHFAGYITSDQLFMAVLYDYSLSQFNPGFASKFIFPVIILIISITCSKLLFKTFIST